MAGGAGRRRRSGPGRAAATDGNAGRKVELVVDYHGGRKHLPAVQLRRVAQSQAPSDRASRRGDTGLPIHQEPVG